MFIITGMCRIFIAGIALKIKNVQGENMKTKLFFLSLFYFIPVLLLSPENNVKLELTQTVKLPNVAGRIDHMAIDVRGSRIFMAALGNNSLEIIDLEKSRVIKSIPGLSEPQGVAYVPQFDKIYVTNGGNGDCNIFDAKTYKLISTVRLNNDADNVHYDEAKRILYVGYGDGGIYGINVKNDSEFLNIQFSGHPEGFAIKKNGSRIFVNVPEFERSILIIDRYRKNIIERWKIGNLISNVYSNFPLCLDNTNNRLFIGTFIPSSLIVIDSMSGKLITKLGIPSDCDDIFYDEADKIILLSCGEGFIDVIKQNGPDEYRELFKVPTFKGARTSLFTEEPGLYFLAVPRHGNNAAELQVYKIIRH